MVEQSNCSFQSKQTLEKVPTLAIDKLTDFLTLLAHVRETVKK